MNPISCINNLINKGYQEIGSGAYCRVFSKPELEYVIKISKTIDGNYYYLEKIINRTESCFPKIYQLKKFDNFYICIIERLTHANNPELNNTINSYKDKQHKNKLDFLKEFNFYPSYEIVKEIIKNNKYFLDISKKNIMLRDKTFVLTDLIA